MIEDPLEYLESHIKENFFQYDIDEKFCKSYLSDLTQLYSYFYPGTRFTINFDRKKEEYKVFGKPVGKPEIKIIHTKDDFISGEAYELGKSIIKRIKLFMLEKEHLTWRSNALNFQHRITMIERKLKLDDNKYFQFYLKGLSAIQSFLLSEYLVDVSVGGSNNSNIVIKVRKPKAINRFYKQLVQYKFIKDHKVPFNQFFAGKHLDERIQWLTTATDFNAFIKFLCDKKYIEFKNQSKWKTLKEIFVLPNTTILWENIKALKAPNTAVQYKLRNCFFELEEVS